MYIHIHIYIYINIYIYIYVYIYIYMLDHPTRDGRPAAEPEDEREGRRPRLS